MLINLVEFALLPKQASSSSTTRSLTKAQLGQLVQVRRFPADILMLVQAIVLCVCGLQVFRQYLESVKINQDILENCAEISEGWGTGDGLVCDGCGTALFSIRFRVSHLPFPSYRVSLTHTLTFHWPELFVFTCSAVCLHESEGRVLLFGLLEVQTRRPSE